VLVLNSEGKYQKQIPFPKDYGFFSDLSVDSKGTLFLIDCIKTWFSRLLRIQTASLPNKESERISILPTSITTDNRGTIYVVDQNGSGIVILDRMVLFRGGS